MHFQMLGELQDAKSRHPSDKSWNHRLLSRMPATAQAKSEREGKNRFSKLPFEAVQVTWCITRREKSI
eukprot:2955089-Rhodomonas_salina.1